jgi:hypothetical protein
MRTIFPIFSVVCGVVVIAFAVQTSVRTFLLPQPGLSLLTGAVFRGVRPFFSSIEHLLPAKRRHAWMSIYAPLCLVAIVFLAMVFISLGYTLIFYGLGLPTLEDAFLVSISAISTLGFASLPNGVLIPIVATLETMTGIFLVALLIGYLPSIYAAVQQREQALASLIAHVGSPLSGEAILVRHGRAPEKAHLDELWTEWQKRFAGLGASHNSLAGIIFVQSPEPDQSWVTVAGAVLDAAALAVSTLHPPGNTAAEHCLETGSQALQQIFESARPLLAVRRETHEDGLLVTQEEFAEATACCAAAGMPAQADRDEAWRVFARWRGTYEAPLLALGHLTHATVAPLSTGCRNRKNAARQPHGSGHQRGQVVSRG